MPKYTCPTDGNNPIKGCGRTFTAKPDDEGLVDCPHCGMWFKPYEGEADKDA